MAIKSTAIDAPWRSIFPLLPDTFLWCSLAEIGIDFILTYTCYDCAEFECKICKGCLKKECLNRLLQVPCEYMPDSVNEERNYKKSFSDWIEEYKL
jgi:hypothetical protein